MAAEEENNKTNEGKGFAGLSSLVSDIDTTPPLPAPKSESVGSTTSTGRPAAQTAQPQPHQQPQRQTYQEPPQQSPGSSGGKWLLGIAAVVGLLWLIDQPNKPKSSPTPAYSTPAQSSAPSYSPPVQPQAPSVPQESKPPVGQDLVFSTAQIRYCLAEDIRMEGAKAALNKYSDSDVDRFNAMVADYNSRCGSFRYRSDALESARRDIEPYRSQLHDEGRLRLARSPSAASQAAQSIASGKQGALSVQFAGDCWAQVTDANGRILYSGLKRNGESLELVGLEPLELRLGYALGAKVKYNGIAVDITPYASGETARIRFGG